MKFSFEEKLRYNDLDFNFTDMIQKQVEEQIRADEEVMKELKADIKEEYPTIDNKSFQNELDCKIYDLASKAVDSIKIYCSFDLEVYS